MGKAGSPTHRAQAHWSRGGGRIYIYDQGDKSTSGNVTFRLSLPTSPRPLPSVYDVRTRSTGRQTHLYLDISSDLVSFSFSLRCLGWWFVSNEQEEGWAPCSYLERLNGKEEEETISSLGEHFMSFATSQVSSLCNTATNNKSFFIFYSGNRNRYRLSHAHTAVACINLCQLRG